MRPLHGTIREDPNQLVCSDDKPLVEENEGDTEDEMKGREEVVNQQM